MKYFSLLMIMLFMLASNAFAFDAKKYFKANCTSCHLIGGGDKTGPDLAGVSKRRSVEWIVKFMNYPEGMINGDEDEEDYPVNKACKTPACKVKFEYGDKVAYSLYQLYKPNIMTEHEVDKAQVKALLKYIDSVATKPGKKSKINSFKVLKFHPVK